MVYTVALASRPTGTVRVDIDRTGSTKVVVNPMRLTFMPDEWNVAQEVVVESARDADDDEEEAELSHRASGADYGGVTAPSPVTVTVVERGVCHRSPPVRDALIPMILRYPGNCDDVTDAMLATVRNLLVDKERFGELTSLRPGDFAGLTGLRTLWIHRSRRSDRAAGGDIPGTREPGGAVDLAGVPARPVGRADEGFRGRVPGAREAAEAEPGGQRPSCCWRRARSAGWTS